MTYIHFKNVLFHYGLSQDIEFPVLYSRTLVFIHPVYNSWHLPIPDSQSLSSPPPPPWQTQVCSLINCAKLYCKLPNQISVFLILSVASLVITTTVPRRPNLSLKEDEAQCLLGKEREEAHSQDTVSQPLTTP